MGLSRLPLDQARAAIGAAAGLYLLSLIPLYGALFGGCDAAGFATLQLGCSDWPEFLRGFVFVACCAVAPRQFYLALIATVIVFAVAALGGAAYVGAGQFGYSSPRDAVFVFLAGLPVFLGGLVAYVFHLLPSRKASSTRVCVGRWP